jgi:hypothetical protein
MTPTATTKVARVPKAYGGVEEEFITRHLCVSITTQSMRTGELVLRYVM